MTTIRFQPYTPGLTASENSLYGSIDPRLSRTNYFDGQLLKASDLSRDQNYLDERLLELGQVLGSGIAQGLELELVDNHILRLQPGIAVAPSGRVLQLSSKTLEIDLQDSGFITVLNKGQYRRFNRGLYVVALNYAEVIDGVSESYPADLASRTKMQVNSYAEGVELTLIPLNIILPRGDEISIRAALAQQFIAQDNRYILPTDEAVALGLIAIDNARPIWLDMGLLRRPLQRPNTTNILQLNLATHYRELFAEVLALRQKSGRNDDFAASSYFRLLPPYGPIPKGAIDPVTGRQSYFPQDYEVAIAPARRIDIASIIEESAHLAPIDFSRDADADVMVLVPMSDQAFALRARQLEKSAQAKAQEINKEKSVQSKAQEINKFPYFNSLALRLFTQPPAHLIDTDADAWRAIWEDADPGELIFVRRPPRTAETNVSAVVLARGFDLPSIKGDLPPDPASLEAQLDKALEEEAQATAALAQKASQISALQEQITQLEQTIADNTQLQDALNQLQAAQAELNTCKNDLAKSNRQVTSLQTKLDSASAQVEDLKTQLDSANAEIEVLKTQLNSANTEIENLRVQLDSANAQIAKLEKNIGLQQRLSFVDLGALRNADPAAAEKLDALVGSNDAARVAVVQLLTLTPSSFDRALWPSLISVAQKPENLILLKDLVSQSVSKGVALANAYMDNGIKAGMTDIDIGNWKSLVG